MKKYIILILLLAWGILASAQNEAEKVIKVQPKFEPRTELGRIANTNDPIEEEEISELGFNFGSFYGDIYMCVIILRNEKTGEKACGLRVFDREVEILRYKYIDPEEVSGIIDFVKKVQDAGLAAPKKTGLKKTYKMTTKDLVRLETTSQYLVIGKGFAKFKKLDKFIDYLERVQAYLSEEQKKDLEKSN